MALPDLTGQNIQDTYQRLVQVDATGSFTDGTGSNLPISIEGDNVRVTGDIIANQYVVSSSVTNITTQTLSGSTQFGDSTDDTHIFTGNITASGAISASGDVYADAYYSEGQAVINYVPGQDRIQIGNKPTYIQGNITASGDISSSGNVYAAEVHTNHIKDIDDTGTEIDFSFGDQVHHKVNGVTYIRLLDMPGAAQDRVGINEGGADIDLTVNGNNYDNLFRTDADENYVEASGSLRVTGNGHITASGDISQSTGRLFTNHIELVGNNNFHGGDIGLPIQANHVQITDPNNGPIAAHALHSRLTVDGDITANSHITASGHLSSSGNIFAAQHYAAAVQPRPGHTSLAFGTLDIASQDYSLTIGHHTNPAPLTINSNITASKNISGSSNSIISSGTGSFHRLKGDSSYATGLEVNGYIYGN